MKNLFATITDNKINLEKAADSVNSGRTDNVSIYVNGNRVSVSYTYGQLSEERQKQELDWFLSGRTYVIN